VAGPYTTKLQAGLGLIPETYRLLAHWQPGMSPAELHRIALQSGDFSTMTARRLRNIVIEAFAPRYLVDAGQPAALLKTLVDGNVGRQEIRRLFFLYTCRANPILADFVKQVYWAKHEAGEAAVAKADALDFTRDAVAAGLTTRAWSESTVIRVSRYLLGTCADFGLLGAMENAARPIQPFGATPLVSAILAHDLHFKGTGDAALLDNEDWRLFGLQSEDVLAELKRLAQQGGIIVQSAGSIVRISWKIGSLEALADEFVQG
jgi:hypothetical protein